MEIWVYRNTVLRVYNMTYRGVAQRLARHVRDVEAGGSNPLTPTTPQYLHDLFLLKCSTPVVPQKVSKKFLLLRRRRIRMRGRHLITLTSILFRHGASATR